MSDLDFSKYDNEFDLDGLMEDIEKAANGEGGNGDYKEVPFGSYEVSIDKLELGVSKKGSPMLICWFKIIEGEYKNSRLFMNQVVTSGYGIHVANEFLRSLDSDITVEFKSYSQYANMILDISEAIDGLEYAIEYGETSKGYKTFEITDVFES